MLAPSKEITVKDIHTKIINERIRWCRICVVAANNAGLDLKKISYIIHGNIAHANPHSVRTLCGRDPNCPGQMASI